jgi:hypothetical protein
LAVRIDGRWQLLVYQLVTNGLERQVLLRDVEEVAGRRRFLGLEEVSFLGMELDLIEC